MNSINNVNGISSPEVCDLDAQAMNSGPRESYAHQGVLAGPEKATRVGSNGGVGDVEWYTPPEIFTALDLHFDLDPASPLAGPVPWIPADRFLSPIDNGLVSEWKGRVWLNPPYGRGIERWVRKMVEYRDGLMLTMVRTDTAWWQLAAEEAEAVCFLRGRVKFVPGREVPAGKRSPTDRPGASNSIFAFGHDNAYALRDADLGVTFMAPRVRGVA